MAGAPIRALLLAGGYGTRLGPLGREGPKALLELGGRSLADRLAEDLARVPGAQELVVVTNSSFFPALETWASAVETEVPFPVRVLDDGTAAPDERLGAVGDLAFALERTSGTGDLLVLASDTLPGFPLRDFVGAFRGRPGADVLLAVEEEEDPERLGVRGVVQVDRSGRVTRFQEKPGRPASRLTALPLYLLRAGVLPLVPEYLAAGGEADAPGHLVAWLVDRVRVEGWKVSGTDRVDVGTPEGYAEARRRFEGRERG